MAGSQRGCFYFSEEPLPLSRSPQQRRRAPSPPLLTGTCQP